MRYLIQMKYHGINSGARQVLHTRCPKSQKYKGVTQQAMP